MAALLPAVPADSAAANATSGFFTVGSTKDEVLGVQGTPSSFSYTYWVYGRPSVRFQNDRVTSWNSSPFNPPAGAKAPLSFHPLEFRIREVENSEFRTLSMGEKTAAAKDRQGPAVLAASRLSAQPGRSRHCQPHFLVNKALMSVRAEQDLCRKSSKCIQCGEPTFRFKNIVGQ
jgi:hypothetical protein